MISFNTIQLAHLKLTIMSEMDQKWISYYMVLCYAAVMTVLVNGKTGIKWEKVESDGSMIRVLSDNDRIITMEYNNGNQLVQCWAEKEGRTSDAISLMFYSVSSDCTE